MLSQQAVRAIVTQAVRDEVAVLREEIAALQKFIRESLAPIPATPVEPARVPELEPEVEVEATAHEPEVLYEYVEPVVESAVEEPHDPGAERTFAQWAVMLRPELLQFARSLSRNDAVAEDVVQASLLRAYKAWDTFVPSERADSIAHAVRGYLFRIVRNTYLNEWRRTKRRPEVHLPDNAVTDLPDTRQAEVAHSSPSDDVLLAVARLTPVNRQVIEMHYLEEISTAEIALRLDIEQQTVLTRLNRGRVELRKRLAEYAKQEYGITPKSAPCADPVIPPMVEVEVTAEPSPERTSFRRGVKYVAYVALQAMGRAA